MKHKVALIIALVALGAGCSSSDDKPAAEGAGVVVENYAFPPLSTEPSGQVAFRNEDDEPHTVTADDGSFRVASFGKGEVGTLTAPQKPGTYEYHCEVHPTMRGTLVVR